MSRPTLGPLPRAGLPLRVGSRGACFSVMAISCGRAGMNGPVGYASSLLGVWGRQWQLRSPGVQSQPPSGGACSACTRPEAKAMGGVHGTPLRFARSLARRTHSAVFCAAMS